MYLEVLVSTAIAMFALATLVLGLFSVSVGAGRTKRVGLVLTLIGLLCGVYWTGTTLDLLPENGLTWELQHATTGLLAMVGGLSGLVIGVAIFFSAVVRS